jgi:large subunit ribosomal protein L7/L12
VFNVKLESFDPASKAKIIREVKARVPNLGLIEVRTLASVLSPNPPSSPDANPFLFPFSLPFCSPQAKKFVESLPKILKENMPKEEAEKVQKAFADIGAVVKLE